MKFFTKIKDKIVRSVAKVWVISYFDGYKKELSRVFLAVQMILLAIIATFPDLAVTYGIDNLESQWLLLAAWLGLEFGIEDEEIKRKRGIEY